MDSRDLQGLMEAYTKICAPVDEAVYGGEPKKPEAPKDDRMVVTAADKRGNTPAYQKFKAGHKGYKAADHLGEESVDEAVKGASPHAMEMRKGDAADRRKGIKPLSAKKGEEYAKYKMSQMAHSERKRMGEELDTFDAILEYLVAEGYAATNKEALVIMANMSEEWRSEIVEGIGTKLAAAGLAGIMGAGMMNAQNAVIARRQYPGGPVATDRTELVSKTDKKNKEPDQVELVKQRDAATEKKDKEERERMTREYQRIGGDAKAKKYGINSDNAEYINQYHRGRK